MKTLRNAVQKRTGPKPYGMVFVKFARADTLKALPTLRTPTNRHLLPCHPLRTPFCQVLPLRNQTLVNRTGEQGDAVPADLVAEVLAGDTDA
jgi:hypothetical protein